MDYRTALTHIDKHKIILTVGNEPFYRDQIANRVSKDGEVIKFDCEEVDQATISSTIRLRDLFNTKRVFILKNFLKLKKLDFLLNSKITDKIILDSEKAGKSKAYEELKKKVLFIDCSSPKPWHEENDFINKATGFLTQHGYSISESDAKYLYNQLGYNLYRLMNELQKLIMYKEKPSSITKEDIDAICIKGLQYNIFDVIDLLIDRKKADALELLKKIFKFETNPSILLISLWYSHFENLLYLKTTTREVNTLTRYIKMPPMVITKKLIPQSKKISISQLVKSMDRLLKIDHQLRLGSFDLQFFIEKFILQY